MIVCIFEYVQWRWALNDRLARGCCSPCRGWPCGCCRARARPCRGPACTPRRRTCRRAGTCSARPSPRCPSSSSSCSLACSGTCRSRRCSRCTWGDHSVSSCRSYSRGKGAGTSAGKFPMAHSRSGEDPRGHRWGAKGSCGTPRTPCVSSPAVHVVTPDAGMNTSVLAMRNVLQGAAGSTGGAFGTSHWSPIQSLVQVQVSARADPTQRISHPTRRLIRHRHGHRRRKPPLSAVKRPWRPSKSATHTTDLRWRTPRARDRPGRARTVREDVHADAAVLAEVRVVGAGHRGRRRRRRGALALVAREPCAAPPSAAPANRRPG